MSDKIKITFVLPKRLQKEMREQIVKDGYSMRDKSRWVVEAIEQLLSMSNFEDLVNYGNEMTGFSGTETIVVDTEIRVQLDRAILDIRRVYPALEGVQSRILRTSILQRLIRTPT